MKCPVCHEKTLHVHKTITEPTDYTHRYMHCGKCGSTFQTVEIILEGTLQAKFYTEYQPGISKIVSIKTKKSA